MTVLWLLAGILTSYKVYGDLKAFEPGPPRISDLFGFVIPLLVLILVALAIAPQGAPDLNVGCLPPCIVVHLS